MCTGNNGTQLFFHWFWKLYNRTRALIVVFCCMRRISFQNCSDRTIHTYLLKLNFATSIEQTDISIPERQIERKETNKQTNKNKVYSRHLCTFCKYTYICIFHLCSFEKSKLILAQSRSMLK